MRRLYVGGLNHTVTQKDLKDRFEKFGEVLDVELRTRKDEEGIPYKTFAYININISEADLKKCMTVLNKSKWKGGTLQIEAAKESFLHRLAQERQQAADHHLQRSATEAKKQKLLDSWSKAGVQNFTMKAAVPGSEVPGCKDWVVSKFGRVLPVLQLRCQKGSKARTVKYDPSKYCHNIRRLDRTDPDETLSVTQLTWQVEGGDDDISKRRRGEFPPYEPIKSKKSRTDPGDSLNTFSRIRSEQNSDRNTEVHQLTNGSDLPTNHRAAQREERWFLDSDVDSDEEIRCLVATQQSSHDALQQEAEDSLEVVGLDYLVKSGSKGDEEDYDSAGTDELFESRRKPPAPPQEKPSSPPAQQFSDKKRQMKRKTTPGDVSSSKPSSSVQRENPAGVRPAIKHSSDSHSDQDDEEEEGNSSDSSSDFDFPALFSANSNYLRISLADLQRLAESKVPSILRSGLKPESGLPGRHARKEAITPDEILASILGEDSSGDDEEHKKKKKKVEGVTSASLQTSEETATQRETSQTDGRLRRKREQEQNEASGIQRQKHGETPEALRDPQTDSSSGSEEEEEEMMSAEDQPSSSSSSEEEEQQAGAPAPGSKSSSSEEEEEEEEAPPRVALAAKEEEELQRKANMRRLAALQQRQKEAEEHKKLIQGALANLDAPPPTTGKRIVFGSDDEEEKQEVVSAVEESKKPLFQDSQSEDEATADGAAAANQNAPHKAERLKPSGPRLFDDSEDDDEEGDEEEDGSRFDIRPEFEGPAGQKLMELQSRFGTDERFRLDSRFLEDEEEEEETEVQKGPMEDEEALEEEKKKNLSILQSVLGTSQQASSKTSRKAKQFRDVSALHYDPSKEEHTAFETKTEETKKESKAARRKKREEAQKLPEVSKEIYFQVSGDLKAVFGQTNDGSAEGEEGTNWDKVEEEEGGGEEEQLLPSLLSADPSSKSEESSGFRFSFFGDESAAGSGETAEYKTEKIQAPKVSWHQDPRFHDSSSEDELEEDEEEEEEHEEQQSSVEAKNTKEETPSQPDFFFFSSDDHRLKEGPRLFCRTSQLEEQREEWEERTSTLRQEYRKKHRDAQRKLKSARKTRGSWEV